MDGGDERGGGDSPCGHPQEHTTTSTRSNATHDTDPQRNTPSCCERDEPTWGNEPWARILRAPGSQVGGGLAEVASGHRYRHGEAQDAEHGGRDVGEPTPGAGPRGPSPQRITGTGLVVWAVSGEPSRGSTLYSALPWSAVMSIDPPAAIAASAMLPMQRSMVSTGGDGGVEDAGVADHVGVGEVDDDQRVAPGPDAVQHRLGHPLGAHRRREVVGGHLRRGDEQPVLAGERLPRGRR